MGKKLSHQERDTVAASSGPAPEAIANITPLLRQIVMLVGRRSDDPELMDFVTGTLGKKAPASMGDVLGCKNVAAKKQGLELAFGHDVKNQKYPLIKKSGNSYVPYLKLVWLHKNLTEPLPFGLQFGMPEAEIGSTLRTHGVLDPARDVVLGVDGDSFTISVDEARELSSRYGVPPRPSVGLFVSWAILRNLIDESRFSAHAALLAAVSKRKLKGSALVDAALPRGLWDIDLKDEPGLRDFAYRWFHNIGGVYIGDDLVSVFGDRKGPYGHDEPILDDDDWAAVDKAVPTLDNRFAEWVNKTPTKSRR